MSNPLTGRRVLVVDDMSTIRKGLRQTLGGFGMEVLEAADAEDALLLVGDEHVDLFLLDIHLPGMDGMELCRRLRQMERFQYTPVLFVTSLSEEEISQQAFDVGGDDVIGKPASEPVLQARLRTHLQRREYARQLHLLRNNLDRYVDVRTRRMAEQQARKGQLLKPERREICVLFTDLRGFTQLSQEMDPEQLFSILSEHLSAQVKCVYRFGGYIDKFSGDGVMAVFDGPEMAINSCLCALKIIEEARLNATGDAAALYQVGIGIHIGEAMIGNIGIEKQLDYTVIGPTVNLSARLCGHAKALSTVVSETVQQRLLDEPRVRFSEAMELKVKGVRTPVLAYGLSAGEKPARKFNPFGDVDAMPD
jgi:adenylate cyclase